MNREEFIDLIIKKKDIDPEVFKLSKEIDDFPSAYILLKEILYPDIKLLINSDHLWIIIYLNKQLNSKINKKFSSQNTIDDGLFFLNELTCKRIDELDNKKDKIDLISRFSKAIEINPNDYNLYVQRATIKERREDYKGAISDLDKAIEIDPNNAKSYFYRSNLKKEIEDYKGAISDLDKAIELDPNNANLYSSRSYSKKVIEDYTGAISDLGKAIHLDPNIELEPDNVYPSIPKNENLDLQFKNRNNSNSNDLVFIIIFLTIFLTPILVFIFPTYNYLECYKKLNNPQRSNLNFIMRTKICSCYERKLKTKFSDARDNIEKDSVIFICMIESVNQN